MVKRQLFINFSAEGKKYVGKKYMDGKSVGEKAAGEKSAGELGVCGGEM